MIRSVTEQISYCFLLKNRPCARPGQIKSAKELTDVVRVGYIRMEMHTQNALLLG